MIAMNAIMCFKLSIRLACEIFSISQTCFRYCATGSVVNQKIEHALIELTSKHKRWGFGLCFSDLRNAQGKLWNHKRAYRIYCDLRLNLCIKPKICLKRDKPDALSQPDKQNQIWSMDFYRATCLMA